MNAPRIPAGIRANPPPHESHVIARVQSLRTRNGRVAEPLDYETSRRVLERWNKPKRVTVPEPRVRVHQVREPQWRTDDETGERWLDSGQHIEYVTSPW